MRLLITFVLFSVLCVACKKGTDPIETPDPPDTPDNPTLTTDSNAIRLDAAVLSVTRTFQVRYTGDWSIAMNEADTTWLTVSPMSGTGSTNITVKAKNIHTGSSKRSSVLTISAGVPNAQSVQVEVSQNPYIFSSWSKKYGGSDYDYFKTVLPTPDSGYIALGSAKSRDGDVTENFGDEDLWVVKIDRAGNIMWQRSYGGSGQESPWQLIATDGGYLIAASSNSREIGIGGSHYPWLIKINAQGGVIWQKTYDQKNMGIIGVAKISSGYVLTGQTDSEIPLAEENGVMMKVDKSGTFLWEKTFGGDNNEQFSFVTGADDGGIVAIGNRNFLPPSDHTSTNTADIWMVKTDANGNLLWQTQIGGNAIDLCSSMTNTDDGGYLVSGWGTSPDVPVYHGLNDVFLAKITSNGVVQWKKSLGGSAEEIAPVITSAGSDEYVVATFSASGDGDITNRVGDVWMFKINEGGEVLWTKSGEDKAVSYLNAVAWSPNNTYVVAGGIVGAAWLYSFSEK